MHDANTMKASVFKKKGGDSETMEIPIPFPQKGWVRIKVHCCGVCHSDKLCKDGITNNEYPRVSGHEVIGEIEKLGEGVDENKFKIGKFVGVGWNGGNHCGECRECLNKQFLSCKKSLMSGIDFDGGYAEYMVVPSDAVVIIPDGMNPEETAPLLCAGVTVFSALKKQNIKKGELAGVLGIGGLGHLAIQFCNKMGLEVIALSRGNTKEKVSMELGASHFVDISKDGWIDQIKEIGSVQYILLTAPFAHYVKSSIECLGINGKLILISVILEPFAIDSLSLIIGNKSIEGRYIGDTKDIEETLDFANKNQIKSIIKTFPLEEVNEALVNIANAKFRNVIKMK
ncbi:hypothetical protein ACTA71_007076 [Dictyostelium dimigraforme]